MRELRRRYAFAAAALFSVPLSGAASNRELPPREVASAGELVSAVRESELDIVVTNPLTELPTLRLSPGETLRGATPDVSMTFAPGQEGLQLSSDNRVENLTLATDPDRRAVFNDTRVEHLGRLVLRKLRVTGVVHLLAHDKVRSGHVEAEDVDVLSADARGFADRPKGYGVEVIPGAFTVWNQQADPAVTITADLTGLSVGRAGAPVRGSGIFVGGAGETGGRLIVRRLETRAIYTDGGIASGTSDRISGGVFVVSGAFVDQVNNRDPMATYGPNDMVLDNWGTVGSWTADDTVTSFGPSAIGFVNFGRIDRLEVKGTLETFGQGSRGFNVYAGTVNRADFERIVTHADGAVGIQISQAVGEIIVSRGIETFGGIGDSLVKGVVVKLPATALSIKVGGSATTIDIAGGLTTHSADVSPLELHGSVVSLTITAGTKAAGGGL